MIGRPLRPAGVVAVRLGEVGAVARELEPAGTGRQRGVREGFLWDGRDDSGARVKAGIYMLRVTTAAGSWSGKSLLLR